MQQVKIALTLAVLGAAAIGAEALAQGGPSDYSDEAQAICGGPPPCLAVNNLADPEASGSSDAVVGFAQFIAEHGRPASECPGLVEAYTELGIEIDVVLGSCPDPGAVDQGLSPEALGMKADGTPNGGQ